MKWIKYYFNIPTETEDGSMQDTLFEKSLPYSEAALQIVEEEAYNGEYTIEDDGEPEHDTSTTEDVINALLGVTV